jgi:hypothetical protein
MPPVGEAWHYFRIADNPLIAEVCSNCSLIVPFTSTGKLIRSTLSIRFRMSWLSSEGLLSLQRALLLYRMLPERPLGANLPPMEFRSLNHVRH